MKWLGRRESDNVEDIGSGGGGNGGGGFILGGGATLIIIVISLIFGKNPLQIINQLQSQAPAQSVQTTAPVTGQEDERHKFVRVVLGDTEDVWDKLFKEMGRTYEKPKLALFRGQVQSGCGFASEASGPFYCPADEKVYLDLSFFDELTNRFKAPGELAEAYVIAHEVGHHVQNLLGITQKMERMRAGAGKDEGNKLSVKLELQADFLAGIFVHYDQQINSILEPGDLEAALNAANAVGDDNLQKQTQGYVVPDAFTHGSSKDRMYWFKKGFDTGDIKQGDTFSDSSLE